MSTATRSLLRYPGSKARFINFINRTIRLNGLKGCIFAEPFCGGASVSIALLEAGSVDYIALNDCDPLISQLWDVVFSEIHADWLIEQVLTMPLSIDEWQRQKSLNPLNSREAALKCLYLNRTSFNGIIHKSGPLGGWRQNKQTIGARFNRERLAVRIRELFKLRDRVLTVSNYNWESFCEKMLLKNKSFFYLDPPYYYKAAALYGYHFDNTMHQELRNYLIEFKAPWMLSYDDAPEIRALYQGRPLKARIINSTYSTHPMGGASHVGREVLYSNLARLPAPDKGIVVHSGLTVRDCAFVKPDEVKLTRIPVNNINANDYAIA
ncbi:MAG: DNA adenine methylase [Flavisolibacter sp.]